MKLRKSISDEQENYSNTSSAVEISSKGQTSGLNPCKILGAILEIDKGRTSTNVPEGKKANDA